MGASPAPRSGQAPPFLFEAALVALVFLLAVALRVPALHDVPRYTDEVTLWRHGAALADGGPTPLVFEDTGYNGPLLVYALAALRELTADLYAPRWVAALGSALTVTATYLVARGLAGRLAGLAAALLLGSTFVSVVVYGHVLHMTGLALLFLVVGWWCAVTADARTSGPWLVASGAATGLAVQSHPLAAAFVPGLALWVVVRVRGRTRRLAAGRWGAFAALAALAALSPLIAYHWPGRNGPDDRVAGAGDGLRDHWAEVSYVSGVANMTDSLVDALGGERYGPGNPVRSDPSGLLLLVLGATAAVYSARRGVTLPLLLVASALVTMPIVMRSYDNTLLARYAALALPAFAIAGGTALASLVRGGVTAGRARRRATMVVVAALAALCVGQFLSVLDYYGDERSARRSNDDLERVLMLLETNSMPNVVDGRIRRTDGRGSGPSAVLDGIARWRGMAVKKETSPAELEAYLSAIDYPVQVVLASDTVAELGPDLDLDHVAGGHVGATSDVESWALFVYDPRDDTPGLDRAREPGLPL